MKRRLDSLPLKRIAERYLSGETMPALAREHGVRSAPQLYRRLIKDGYLPRAPKKPRAPKNPRPGAALSREEFIRIWNDSATAEEAATRAGIARVSAIWRATTYRRSGVEMKSMRGRTRIEERRRDAASRLGPGEQHPLRYWRERRGLSLKALARLAGVSHSVISLIENGKSGGAAATLMALAAALDVPLVALTDKNVRLCRNPRCKRGFAFVPTNPRQRYCSATCRKAAQGARNFQRRQARRGPLPARTYVCERCGREFPTKNGHNAHQRFCKGG